MSYVHSYIYINTVAIFIYLATYIHMYIRIYIHISLCLGGSKKTTGIQLQCIPEKRDTNQMYPGKVMYLIGA